METMNSWDSKELAHFVRKIGHQEAADIIWKYKIDGAMMMQIITIHGKFKKLPLAGYEYDILECCICRLKIGSSIKTISAKKLKSESKMKTEQIDVPPQSRYLDSTNNINGFQSTIDSIENEEIDSDHSRMNRLPRERIKVYVPEKQATEYAPSTLGPHNYCKSKKHYSNENKTYPMYEEFMRVPTEKKYDTYEKFSKVPKKKKYHTYENILKVPKEDSPRGNLERYRKSILGEILGDLVPVYDVIITRKTWKKP